MKKTFNVEGAPNAIGPYVHAVQSKELLFLSGQLGLDPTDGSLPEGIIAQTSQALENVKTILLGAGSDLDHVVKTTIYIADMDDFAVVNQIYGTYFKENYPARSCVQVARLPKDALVEIEAIATIKD